MQKNTASVQYSKIGSKLMYLIKLLRKKYRLRAQFLTTKLRHSKLYRGTDRFKGAFLLRYDGT